MKSKLEKNEKVIEKHLTSIKELTENVMILENTVESRNSEIIYLKEEIESDERVNKSEKVKSDDKNKSEKDKQTDEDIPSTSKCGKCDYESEEECEMKKHLESKHDSMDNNCDLACSNKLVLERHVAVKVSKSESDHEVCEKTSTNFYCKTCNLAFSSEDKLDKHFCRVTVRNPSFCDLYTKNWILLNRCSFIYNRIKKVEVALLHCNDCVENKSRCTDKFPIWLPAQVDDQDDDGNFIGLWHLEMKNFLMDGRIQWQAVKTFVKT